MLVAALGNKTYEVVSTLQVVEFADDKEDQTIFPAPQSVKVGVGVVPNYSASGAASVARPRYTVTFGDLPGSSLAQTTGTGPSASITLDKDAEGRGWYIDETPLDNIDDYLPTSNPNIWQAKAGSEAEGKMDMLSVLLNEYGHALGLDHSADAGDFMVSTLQPGQRRLPSSDELALMGQLVAQIKADMQMADASASAAKTSSALAASAANVGLIFDGVGFFFV